MTVAKRFLYRRKPYSILFTYFQPLFYAYLSQYFNLMYFLEMYNFP